MTLFNKDKKTVFVNQIGYLTDGEKRAVITEPCESYMVENENGTVCFEGRTKNLGFDKSSGDNVYEADFSRFRDKGKFRVKANGKYSCSFEISDRAYKQTFDDITKAFYYLRCGCALEKENAGEYIHSVCHSGKARLWSDNSKEYDVSGGWHDAGDYGRYVTAGACTVAHLLYAYIMFKEPFEKQSVNIPENNGASDILNECRWELEWLLKMQSENGGVWHKCTTAHHAAFVMPEEDKGQLYLFDVSSVATADFAAVCALAARVYGYDRTFSDRLKAAALKSYEWLENHGFVGFSNPEGNDTGSYGERTDTDNRFWADCEMYALTGEEKYHELIKKNIGSVPLAELGYGSIAGLGSLCYLLNENKNTDRAVSDKMKASFAEKAETYKNASDSCGYRVAMLEQQYGWGSNMGLMKNAMTYIIADYFNEEKIYKDYINYQTDYLLGLNATGYSYVTGCGENCINYPHLRPAHADGIEKCMPGFVSGGPNAHPYDSVEKELIPEGTPPMKCYADDYRCFSLNEITIYWNSPALFVLAYLMMQ